MMYRLTAFTIVITVTLFFSCANKSEHGDRVVHSTGNPVDQNLERMHVMSFNIRFDNPEDGENAWPHRKDFFARLIRSHADLLGTQEGLANQLEDLDDLLAVTPTLRYDRVGISRDGYMDKGEFCAIYFRPDRYELLDHDTFWLSENPDEPGIEGWDAVLPRVVTWARLNQKFSGRSFYVFNTHFDHRGSESREQSSRLLLEKIVEIAGSEPVIVMGDLNAARFGGMGQVA